MPTAKLVHVGVPVAEKLPNMKHIEGKRLWVTDSEESDFKIEYLKYEEGTPYPDELHHRFHVGYQVDDLDFFLAKGDRVICGPLATAAGGRVAFVEKDGVAIELFEERR